MRDPSPEGSGTPLWPLIVLALGGAITCLALALISIFIVLFRQGSVADAIAARTAVQVAAVGVMAFWVARRGEKRWPLLALALLVAYTASPLSWTGNSLFAQLFTTGLPATVIDGAAWMVVGLAGAALGALSTRQKNGV